MNKQQMLQEFHQDNPELEQGYWADIFLKGLE